MYCRPSIRRKRRSPICDAPKELLEAIADVKLDSLEQVNESWLKEFFTSSHYKK
jgi:hypothetical protein